MPRKKRILIVDDEPGVLALLRTILKKEKFEVLESLSADDALELLEHETVDLVISDIKMPGMSGIEFLDEVREWDMDLPVLFVSGKGTDRDWSKVMQSSASGVIEKPFKRETLMKAIHQALSNGSAPAANHKSIQDSEFLEI